MCQMGMIGMRAAPEHFVICDLISVLLIQGLSKRISRRLHDLVPIAWTAGLHVPVLSACDSEVLIS